jgi:gliding motility-associated-like protein
MFESSVSKKDFTSHYTCYTPDGRFYKFTYDSAIVNNSYQYKGLASYSNNGIINFSNWAITSSSLIYFSCIRYNEFNHSIYILLSFLDDIDINGKKLVSSSSGLYKTMVLIQANENCTFNNYEVLGVDSSSRGSINNFFFDPGGQIVFSAQLNNVDHRGLTLAGQYFKNNDSTSLIYFDTALNYQYRINFFNQDCFVDYASDLQRKTGISLIQDSTTTIAEIKDGVVLRSNKLSSLNVAWQFAGENDSFIWLSGNISSFKKGSVNGITYPPASTLIMKVGRSDFNEIWTYNTPPIIDNVTVDHAGNIFLTKQYNNSNPNDTLKFTFNNKILFKDHPRYGTFISYIIKLAPNGELYWFRKVMSRYSSPAYFYLFEDPCFNIFGFGNCHICFDNNCNLPDSVYLNKDTGINGFGFSNFVFKMNPYFLDIQKSFNCSAILLKAKFDNIYSSYSWKVDQIPAGVNSDLDLSPYLMMDKINVMLTAEKHNGCSDSITALIDLTDIDFVKSGFEVNKLDQCQWTKIKFKNTSKYNRHKNIHWLWDFGDGSIDTSQNPTHIYTSTGSYSVVLYAQSDNCADSFLLMQQIKIIPAPKPGFTISDTGKCVPITIKLIEQSSGIIVKRIYTSGNGDTSVDINPAFTFSQPGQYIIKQQLVGPTGCMTTDSMVLNFRQGISLTDTIHMECLTVKDNDVYMRWQKIPSVREYYIYKKTTSGLVTQLGLQSGNEFTDSSASLQRPLSYGISALDSCGNVSQVYEFPIPVISVVNYDNEYSKISWNSIEGATEYCVEKETDDKFTEIYCGSLVEFADFNFIDLKKVQTCYRLSVKFLDRCDFRGFPVCVKYDTHLELPNIFTPNNDTINDVYRVYATGIMNFNLQIYNTWGEKVFESFSPTDEWKGERCPEGVYYYILTGTGTDGSFSKKGNITLLR